MINKQPIKDFYGKILGYISEDTTTGIKKATDFYGKVLGQYDPKEDRTRDFYGRIVSRGDTTQALVYNSVNRA